MGSFLYIGTGKDCLLICVKSGSGKRAGAVRTRERQESGSGKRAEAAREQKRQESMSEVASIMRKWSKKNENVEEMKITRMNKKCKSG